MATTSGFLCGLDIGGTFTDCVLIDSSGKITISKSSSTPEDFSIGVVNAISGAAKKLDLSLEVLLGSIDGLIHGTTVGTNAIIQRKGAKVGLITTKGHNDVIHIMRGSRGLSAQDIKLIVHIPESTKPDPIVPKKLIRGVSERVDCMGKTVVKLNTDETYNSIEELFSLGCESIAICCLWSFLNPSHEKKIKEMVTLANPHAFVTCSSELVPKWGEYERTTAVALNAYIGPTTVGYINRLNRKLKELGYKKPLQISQCAGGTISVAKANDAPLLTLDSGPVSGVTGSVRLGTELDTANIITTDLGGTSFDVGVIHGLNPTVSYKSLVRQYEYFLPKVDVQTLGTGGGSKIKVDGITKRLSVGPDSAGASPGPVCYDKGGKEPTLTDADLVLGYLSEDNFAGGSIRLNREKSVESIRRLAKQLKMDEYEFAGGVTTIAEFQMADLIRKVTVQKGLDPRDFVVFAFGGAGPVHMGVTARELGIKKVYIPFGDAAAVWCAFGAASADISHVNEKVKITSSPFDKDDLNNTIEELEEKGNSQLEEDFVPNTSRIFGNSIDMRHKGQINEVEISLEEGHLTKESIETLHSKFTEKYEQLYGKGSSLPGSQLEIVTFRSRAAAVTQKPKLIKQPITDKPLAKDVLRDTRNIYWVEQEKIVPTPIFDGYRFRTGNVLDGPCVVETDTTSIVVHPDQLIRMDDVGNFIIEN